MNIAILDTHTHIKKLEKKKELVLLNPGSCALPKDDIPSIAVFRDSNISLINIENGEIIKSLMV